jgi:hypothetical protein
MKFILIFIHVACLALAQESSAPGPGHTYRIEIKYPRDLPFSSSKKSLYIRHGYHILDLLTLAYWPLYSYVNQTITTLPTAGLVNFDTTTPFVFSFLIPPEIRPVTDADNLKWQIPTLQFDEKSRKITSLTLVVVDKFGM